MNSFILFEDLLANALIEKIERKQGRDVSISELSMYGKRVAKWWDTNRGIVVTVLDSYYDINRVLLKYPDYFIRHFDSNGEMSIYLKAGKKSVDLRKEFRPHLSVDALLSFIQSY